jgi:hypothetical protein
VAFSGITGVLLPIYEDDCNDDLMIPKSPYPSIKCRLASQLFNPRCNKLLNFLYVTRCVVDEYV